MTLKTFISKIKSKDVEGNRTYLSATVNGQKFGQSYQNTVNTKEGMINSFAVFYYQLIQN